MTKLFLLAPIFLLLGGCMDNTCEDVKINTKYIESKNEEKRIENEMFKDPIKFCHAGCAGKYNGSLDTDCFRECMNAICRK